MALKSMGRRLKMAAVMILGLISLTRRIDRVKNEATMDALMMSLRSIASTTSASVPSCLISMMTRTLPFMKSMASCRVGIFCPFPASSVFSSASVISLTLPCPSGRPVHRIVVDDHEMAVGRPVHVQLDPVHADLDGLLEGEQRVLGLVPRSAPVPDDHEIVHNR